MVRTANPTADGKHMSQLLASKIASVRRKHALFAALRGACAMLGAAVLLLAIGMLLDWYIEFPWRLRAAILAIDLTVLTYMLLTQGVKSWFYRRYGD